MTSPRERLNRAEYRVVLRALAWDIWSAPGLPSGVAEVERAERELREAIAEYRAVEGELGQTEVRTL